MFEEKKEEPQPQEEVKSENPPENENAQKNKKRKKKKNKEKMVKLGAGGLLVFNDFRAKVMATEARDPEAEEFVLPFAQFYQMSNRQLMSDLNQLNEAQNQKNRKPKLPKGTRDSHPF